METITTIVVPLVSSGTPWCPWELPHVYSTKFPHEGLEKTKFTDSCCHLYSRPEPGFATETIFLGRWGELFIHSQSLFVGWICGRAFPLSLGLSGASSRNLNPWSLGVERNIGFLWTKYVPLGLRGLKGMWHVYIPVRNLRICQLEVFLNSLPSKSLLGTIVFAHFEVPVC